MSYGYRRGPCEVCGKYVERNRHSADPHRCLPCALDAATEAAVQMHNRSGPLWDKYVAKREARVARRQEAARSEAAGAE